MYPSLVTAPNGSTVHLSRSTPTTSVCAISSNAFDGYLNVELFSRATKALRPGDSGSSSAVIPSFCNTAAMYFAAASSLPGGLVVLILIKSISQPVASRASAEVSPNGPLDCVITGCPATGCPIPGTCAPVQGPKIARHSAPSNALHTSRILLTLFSPVLCPIAPLRNQLANVFLQFCFILTCD